MAISEELNYLWRFRGGTPSFNQFVQSLEAGVLCQFVVTARDNNTPVGLVVAYNADLRNRFCYVAACLSPHLILSGVGVEAVLLVMRYVFHCWEFRKIYIEAPDLNFDQYRGGESLGLFTEEGRLRDHTYMGGRYWDMHILALTPPQVERGVGLFKLSANGRRDAVAANGGIR
jgi:RimJ/RimL family protein N-acetyltransferase